MYDTVEIAPVLPLSNNGKEGPNHTYLFLQLNKHQKKLKQGISILTLGLH